MTERSLGVLPWVLMVLLLACALIVFNHKDRLAGPPWEDQVDFWFPSVTALEDSGGFYVSDSATRRILALDSSGTLRWILQGGRRDSGFYYAQGLAVDRQQRLYVRSWNPEEGRDFVARDVGLIRYTRDGVFDRQLLSLPNTSGDDSFPGYFSFFLDGNEIYFLLGDGGELRLERMGQDDSSRTLVRQLPLDRNWVSLAARTDGTMYGVSRDGRLWQAPPDSSWEPLDVPGLLKPWDLRVGPDGALLILDVLRGEILRLAGEAPPAVILSIDSTGGALADYFGVSPSGSAVISADKDGHRILIAEQGREPRAVSPARLSALEKHLNWLAWGSLILGLGALGGLGVLMALRVIRGRRVPLLIIQLLVFVPILIAAQVIAFSQVYSSLTERFSLQVQDTLRLAAQLTARKLPVDALEQLDTPADLESEAYRTFGPVASDLLSRARESKTYSFMAVYRLIEGQICYVYTGSGIFGVGYPYQLLPEQALPLLEAPGSVYATYSDDYGLYESAFAPVVRSDGRVAGLVEVGIFADLAKDMEDAYLSSARITALVSGILFILLFTLLTMFLLRSLNRLRKMTRQIAEGAGGAGAVRIDRPGKDEIGRLARDFESMSRRIGDYVNDIRELTRASARFVPKDFIGQLGVQDLTELKLGDQVSSEMTVMFVSFLNFRKITGHLSGQGVFRFLNSYLASTVPLILKKGGLIDKYIGETYMAIFPGSPRQALESLSELQRWVHRTNRRRQGSGSEPFQLSFGIHTGQLMLGIVGESRRLEGTVIADSVNLASRINGLCRIYGVAALVSAQSLEKAGPWPHRKVDLVRVKGKAEPVLICQALDPGLPDTKKLVEAVPQWNQAFELWLQGRLTEAQEAFRALVPQIGEDPVLKRHLDRLRQRAGQEGKGDFSPVVDFDEK